MALLSRLSEVVRNFRNPVPVERLPNELARQGVKPAEIEQSRIMENATQLADEQGRVRPSALQASDATRPDVRQFGVRSENSYAEYSVPTTNPNTYRARVYTDPRGIGSSDHFAGQYSYHTRSDILEPEDYVNTQSSELEMMKNYRQDLELEELDETEVNDRLLRFTQEVLHIPANRYRDINYLISNSKAPSEVTDDLVTQLKTYIDVNHDFDNYDAALELAATQDYLRREHGLLVEAADLDRWFYNSTTEGLKEIVSAFDDAFTGMGGVRPTYGDRALRIQEIQSDVANRQLARNAAGEPTIPFNDIEDVVAGISDGDTSISAIMESFNLTENQAAQVHNDFLDMRLSGEKTVVPIIGKEQETFDVPYVRQALYHELDRAQEEGIREVQIAIKPRGIEQLQRSEGVQKNYETTVKNTAQKIARQIGAEVKEKDGWLIIGLPAAGFSLPLYAQEGEPALELNQAETFIRTAVEQGASEEEARDALFIERAKAELGMSAEEAQQFLAQQQQAAPQRTAEGRIILQNEDGTISTEETATVEIEGNFYNVPTIFNGKRVSEEEALQIIKENNFVDPDTGIELQKFSTLEEAIANARARSSELGVQLQQEPTTPSTIQEPGVVEGSGILSQAAAHLKNVFTDHWSDAEREAFYEEFAGFDQYNNTVVDRVAALISDQAEELINNPGVQAGIRQAAAAIGGIAVPVADAMIKTVTHNQKVRELVSAMYEAREVYEPWTDIKVMFGNPEAEARSDALRQIIADDIIPSAAEIGVNLTYEEGQYFVTDDQGNVHEVTPGALQDIAGDKFEIAGGIGGAIGAARWARPTGWFGIAVAGVAGGWVGSVAGTEIDYLNATLQTHETMEAQMAFEKALGATKASLIYDTIGLGAEGLFKAGAFTYRQLNVIGRHVRNGNRQGAMDSLLETLNVTYEEAEEIVRKWETLNDMPAPGRNMDESILSILPTTERGGETIIEQAAYNRPRTSTSVAREVDARATSLLEEANAVTDPEAAERVLRGLRTYVDETSEYLNQAKVEFVEVDITKIPEIDVTASLESAFDTVFETSFNPADNEFLVNRMQRAIGFARSMASGEDVMEFRKILTGLKNSSAVTNSRGLRALDGVIAQVDDYIQNVAKANMGEEAGTEWWDIYKDANRAYSNMLTVQNNGLFNALTKPTTAGKPVTARSVASAILRYGPSIDENYIRFGGEAKNTYREIMDILDPNTVREVEGIIVRDLTDKFTFQVGSFRATDFEMLSKQLDLYDLQTVDAQRIKLAADELASLYKTDIHVARVAGQISLEQFQSYLTTNPWVRAQYMIASQVFNYASQLKGGSKADTRALLNHVGRLLEEPLNTRTTSHIIEAIGDDQELQAAITDFQAAYARGRADGSITPPVRVRIYRDRQGNQFTKPGRGRVLQDITVEGRAMVREDFVKSRHALDTISEETLTPRIRADLINEGFESVMMEDGRVIRLFERE